MVREICHYANEHKYDALHRHAAETAAAMTAAIKANDVDASIKAFKEWQAAFHRESNDAKNAALYVDLVDGSIDGDHPGRQAPAQGQLSSRVF